MIEFINFLYLFAIFVILSPIVIQIINLNPIIVQLSLYFIIFFFYVFNFSLELIDAWTIYCLFTFFVCIYIFISGAISTSVSIKVLKFLANKKYASINQITKKIIKNNLNIRINTLKTKKLIVRKKKLYRLTNSGLKKVDNIKYIRKLFKLKNLGFYK